MSEDKKYYTPKIEEFHPGFDYEKGVDTYAEPEMKWFKKAYDGDDDLCTNQFNNKAIRVKHLNREDIESLGGEKFTENSFKFYKDEEGKKYNLPSHHVKLLEDGEVIITHRTYTVLFHGKIKNKSELNRILIQTGVICQK